MYRDKAAEALFQHRLKIRHLILVKAMADQRSISKAAAALHITQSAATKTLRELEESLGVALFDRTPRGVVPTGFGQALLARADAILNEVNSAADDIAALRSGSAGRIVIGILRAAAPSLLPEAFLQAREQHPDLTIAVVAGTYDALGPGLRAGEIDFLLGYLTDQRSARDLIQETLYSDVAAIVTRRGHPLAKAGRKPSLADLAREQWILPIEGSVLRRHVDEAFQTAGAKAPHNVIESHSTMLVQSFLLQSNMLAVVPRQVALQLEQFGAATILPVAVPGALRVGITTYADRPLRPAAKTLVEILRRITRKGARAR